MPESNDFRAHSNPIPRPGGGFAPVFGTNFPVQFTTLIGRGPEVAAALAMMRRPEVRLLTFTGPGGVGKTRLALRVAEDLAGNSRMVPTWFLWPRSGSPNWSLPPLAERWGSRRSERNRCTNA